MFLSVFLLNFFYYLIIFILYDEILFDFNQNG